MLKNVLAMFKAIIEKGDVQALRELNDVMEENELERIKEEPFLRLNTKEKDSLFKGLDEDDIYNIYDIHTCTPDNGGIPNYLIRMNSAIDLLEKLDIEFDKIHS